MSATELIIDMSNPREKQLILSKIRELEGMHRISVAKYHRRRTDRQNRYYWPCFVQPFAEFLRSQGEPISDDDAHEVLKYQFLRRSVINKQNGMMGEYTQSTTKLTTVEFNTYLDQCATFLHEYAGIHVPDPTIYREAA